MKPSPERPKDAAPVLSLFLLLAGLACGALAAWLATVDLPRLVERQIARAHGSISTESSAWLQESHFQGGLLGAALVLLALGGGLYFQRPALDRLIAKIVPVPAAGSPPARAGPGFWKVALAACAAVFIYFFPTLRSGYFRYDDFDFLSVAGSASLWDAFWQPHGDHFLPLTRLLAWLGLKLFGVTAWPYNLWVLLCLCGVLLGGLLLLEELKVSRPAQLVFAGLVVLWSPWAEIMSGYYILSVFLLITMAGLFGIWFYLRWLDQGKTVQAAGLAACLGLAPLIDISGCYVIGAAGVFLAVNLVSGWRTTGLRGWLIKHRPLLGWLAGAVAISLGCILYDYGVLHPGVFLGMADEGKRSLAQLAADVGYLFGAGLLLSMVTPFVYARLPIGLLTGLMTIVALLWLIFSTAAVKTAGKSRRWEMAAILSVVLGVCLMVCLGRHNADTMIVRWAAKHVGPAYVWLCVLVAVSWDVFWRNVPARRRQLFAELTVIALGLFAATQNAFGLLGMAVAFPPFGYPAEIRDAGRRRGAVEALRTRAIGRAATEAAATIPTLDGSYINGLHPSLFIYNLSRYRPFFGDLAGHVKLVRNPAMQPGTADEVPTVPVLRDAVSPAFMKLLAADRDLRAYYFAGIPLQAQAPGATTAWGDDPLTTVESDGTTELVVRASPWDPETAPHLQLAAQSLDHPPSREIPVVVVFHSGVMDADWQGTLILPDTPDRTTGVDLRQVYAFSLSARVANLRIILPKPGRYAIRARLAP